MRILVASSPSTHGAAIEGAFSRYGHEVTVVGSGADVVALHTDHHLVLLHVDLPDLDGLVVCGHIRRVSDVPIIALVPANEDVDRVLLLQAGADDCVALPCGAAELVARARSVARRSHRGSPGEQAEFWRLRHGPLQLDLRTRQARLAERVLALTPKEFELLSVLMLNADRAVSRGTLMAEVWDVPYSDDPVSDERSSRTVDSHLSSLRQKLGDRRWVVHVRGVGFRIGDIADPPSA